MTTSNCMTSPFITSSPPPTESLASSCAAHECLSLQLSDPHHTLPPSPLSAWQLRTRTKSLFSMMKKMVRLSKQGKQTNGQVRLWRFLPAGWRASRGWWNIPCWLCSLVSGNLMCAPLALPESGLDGEVQHLLCSPGRCLTSRKIECSLRSSCDHFSPPRAGRGLMAAVCRCRKRDLLLKTAAWAQGRAGALQVEGPDCFRHAGCAFQARTRRDQPDGTGLSGYGTRALDACSGMPTAPCASLACSY